MADDELWKTAVEQEVTREQAAQTGESVAELPVTPAAADVKKRGRPPKQGQTLTEAIRVRPWTKQRLEAIADIFGEDGCDGAIKLLITTFEKYHRGKK